MTWDTVGIIASAGGAVFGVWKWLDSKFEKKADKQAVNNGFQNVNMELTLQRSHIAKIFDQMRENEQRAQDRAERILERLPPR